MEKVAFIVVTWNNESIIGECLDSIYSQQGVSPQVYVFDNHSTDATVKVVRGYDHVRLIRSKLNVGFAKGNNVLIEKALEDADVQWVALVNSDARLDPAWTATLLDFARNRDGMAGLQGQTLDYFDRSVVDSQHIFFSGALQGIQYGYGKPFDPGNDYPRKVMGVNAAAALWTRSFIEHQPDSHSVFFDERFHMYYEDIDLAFRGFVAGYDSYFVPEAVAYHMGSVSAKKRKSSYSVTMLSRNQPAVIVKNAPVGVVLRSVPAALVAWTRFLRQVAADHSRWTAVMAVLNTVLGVLVLPRYLSSRRDVMAAVKRDSSYILAVMRNDGFLG